MSPQQIPNTELTPPARSIDPRAQRFGAALSAVILLAAAATGGGIGLLIVALVGIALAASALFGTRYFLFTRPWPALRATLNLAPAEPEHEYPPRFAQALGATFLAIGAVLLAAGLTPVGWLPVLAVVALQVLLATTGICVGCRLYFLRWMVPSLFARLARRTTQGPLPGTPEIRYG
ncbi:MAG: DUF4395 domain-containing protein [Chloroflexi bacterium]|nr:DUF4395 domain-containing protein [Chloroflexota bacterium]